jgi:hypothetical protein
MMVLPSTFPKPAIKKKERRSHQTKPMSGRAFTMRLIAGSRTGEGIRLRTAMGAKSSGRRMGR